ncbi:calcium-binding protein CML38-like [Salvia splendens]|uniref:calcium-binding protein CML38-like n=1 Tax=Salvia splendens TaxID=180675 RepID=UPI001C254E4D|nr:calcium-binding protein CML38-like [Salvia splendens]
MKSCTTYCKRVFNSFDQDRDGKITPSQRQSCLAMMGGGLSAEEAEMVAQPLLSGGLVGLAEFASLVEGDDEEEKKREDLRKAFEMYKNEGEECITPRSLKNMLGRLECG